MGYFFSSSFPLLVRTKLKKEGEGTDSISSLVIALIGLTKSLNCIALIEQVYSLGLIEPIDFIPNYAVSLLYFPGYGVTGYFLGDCGFFSKGVSNLTFCYFLGREGITSIIFTFLTHFWAAEIIEIPSLCEIF